jgi:5-methylcytosine-specific restriction endonuclease McrA
MAGMNGVSGASTLQGTGESDSGSAKRGHPPKQGRSNEPKMTNSTLRAILKEQDYRCALTGLPLTPATANVDHTTPLSRGGEHTPANAQVILDYVNAAKGSMTNEEFIEMCVAVAQFAGEQ